MLRARGTVLRSTIMKPPLAIRRLVTLHGLVLSLLGAAASAEPLPTGPPPVRYIVLADGRWLPVRDYEIRGPLLVFTGLSGELQSLALSQVDLEATERVNRGRRSVTPPDVGPPGALPGTGAESGRSPPSDGGDVDATGGTDGALGERTPAGGSQVSSIETERLVVRAMRLSEALAVDGRLEEAVYRRVPPVSGFVQQEPHEGLPATEQTEVWVLFDDRNLYVGARCWDSHPERIVADEMRRGHPSIAQGDNVTVVLDTFLDRRNGFFFQTNPLGALFDALVTDERNVNIDWDTVWSARASRFDRGWTAEMAIPFKSLRYRTGERQIWGINVRRVIPWKNERSFLSFIPASYGSNGIFHFSAAATLTGVEAPSESKNLEVKPYVISRMTTDNEAEPTRTNELSGDGGFDVKYGLSKGLTADFTYNTDFAQVEADEQQVNLTRFSLFYPEKRSFFLEGQGIFNFGGAGTNPWWEPPSDVPILFFSRRIGLEAGEVVPIRAGARLTGRVGPYTLGALDIQTEALDSAGAPVTNYSVVRLRRDILRRSTVGIIGTNRSPTEEGIRSNQVFGVDTNVALFQDLLIDAYYARSRTPDRTGDEASYRARVENYGDRYGFEYEYLFVGDDFNPGIGFLRRENFERNRARVRFSPRPESSSVIRKLYYEAGIDHVDNGDGNLETREVDGYFGMELQNGDWWDAQYIRSYELLVEPFEIADQVVIPVGSYRFQALHASYTLGRQRKVSGLVTARLGSFFSGRLAEVGYGGRLSVNKRFSLEPSLSVDWVDLAEGRFTTTLVRSRLIYTFSPRMFLTALVQYNSVDRLFASNVRFRWEYQPGSDFYVVYNEGRDTGLSGFPTLENRSLVVKFTRLFRF